MPFSPTSQDLQFTKGLQRSFQQLWDKNNQWRTTGEQIRKLVLPNHSELDVHQMVQGMERTHTTHSSTATIAAPRSAAHLAGNVTPQRIQWFTFDPPTQDPQLLEDEDTDWLQDNPAMMFRSLQSSNFFGEIMKNWLSLLVYGTGAIMSDEHPLMKGEYYFQTIPYGTYVIDEGDYGQLIRFDREIEWSLSKMVDKWKIDALHPTWQAEYKQNPFQVKRIIQIIKVANELDHMKGVPNGRKVASYFIDPVNCHLLEIGSYHEMPVHVGRWFQAAGEDMGRGPGHEVLADIRSDNEIARLALNNLALGTFPPQIGKHEGVVTEAILRPASMIWVMEQGDLQSWKNEARLDIQAYGQERLQASINRAFFQDLINVTSQQPQGKTPISATQVNANIEVMLPIIGPYLSKMEHEQIIPLLNRCFQIKIRARKVEPLPPNLASLMEQMGGMINLNIKGPIARAIQKTNLDSIDSVITRVNTISPIWPEIKDEINIPRTVKMWVLGENAPSEMMNTQEEKEQIQQARAEQMARQQQDQDVMGASEVLKNIGSIPDDQS